MGRPDEDELRRQHRDEFEKEHELELEEEEDGFDDLIGQQVDNAGMAGAAEAVRAQRKLPEQEEDQMEEMFEMQLERDGLTRPQIELVAARTSALNDCFY